MIQKNLSDISAADIEALVASAAPESTTLEFKRDLPGGGDDAKREFLADASALANTSGGDLIYGIGETDGSAAAITGIGISDTDAEVLRLSQILNNGLEPRIRFSPLAISCNGGTVLLLRIEKSWNSPHRVSFRGDARFFGRTAAGKYPLDVQQLRQAFVENASVAERMRGFRADRLASINANVTPVPMTQGSKFVLHLLPLRSFFSEQQYDVRQQFAHTDFRPLSAEHGWGERLTFEGKLVSTATGSGDPPSYVHLYRNGVIEMVDALVLSHTTRDGEGQRYIPSIAFERYIFDGIDRGVRLLQRIGAEGPTAIAVTLTNTKGMTLGFNDRWSGQEQSPILNDHLLLPEIMLTELGSGDKHLMKPAIDLVWNACGLPGSKYLDAKGNWTPPA